MEVPGYLKASILSYHFFSAFGEYPLMSSSFWWRWHLQVSTIISLLCVIEFNVWALLYIALGVLIILLRDQPESTWGNRVLEAVKVSPTVWPLVFAAVIGSRLKASAHRKVEQGATLGVHHLTRSTNKL